MVLPQLLPASRSRLFPPPVAIQNVHTPIAIDVSDSDPVCAPRSFLGNGVNSPLGGWIRGVRLGIAHKPLCSIYKLGFSVVIHVPQQSRFRSNIRDHLMLLPTS